MLPGRLAGDRPPAAGEDKPAADAYTAVLDRLAPDFAYDLKVLIEKLQFERENWADATARLDWYTQDTIFFSLT